MASNTQPAANKELAKVFSGARVTILMSSLVINLLALALPLLMLQLYDRILPFRSTDTLIVLSVTVLIAVFFESVLRVIRSHITAWVAARFEHRAMNAMVNQTLAEPLHQFEKSGTGVLTDRFKSLVTLKYHYSGQSFQQLLDLPFAALYMAIVFVISPWLGLSLAAGYIIFVLLTLFRSRDFPELIEQRKQADARRGNFLSETLSNIHTLKSMTMEAQMLRRHERLQENCARLLNRVAYRLDTATGLGTVFSALMTTLTVALGAWLVIQGQLSNGELAASVLLGVRALAPLQRLGGLWSKHQQDRVLRQQLAQTLSKPTVVWDQASFGSQGGGGGRGQIGTTPSGSLELAGVSYTFPGSQKPIFENLNLKLNGGDCVAISGQGGVGFSTLLKVMAGVLTPDCGQVLLDGRLMSEGGEIHVAQRVAYLPETAEMFEGSLIENISLFDPNRVATALKIADESGLGSFVSRLPRGWDSTVGDMAVDSLPPGFRQRIAIIRALSNNPSVVLFDEATSTMDAEGDRLFLKYLESLKGHVTIVIVSKRPSVLRLADRTLCLCDGDLVPESIEANASHAHSPAQLAILPKREVAETTEAAPVLAALDLRSEELKFWQDTYQTVNRQFKARSDFAACLTVLLKLLNAKNSARDVAEALPYFTESLDLPNFQNTMAQLGYRVSEVRTKLDALESRSLPCLFVPDYGYAFVAMGRVGRKVRVVTDPLAEPILRDASDIEGTAYFYEAVSATDVNGSWVRKVLSRFKPLISQAVVSSIVSGVLLIASSLFLIVVYGSVIPSGSVQTLLYLSVGTAIALCMSYFFIRHRARMLAHIAGRIEYLFGTTVLQHIFRMAPSYTERASVGAQTARIRSFESVRDMFTGPLASTVMELPATLVLIAALALINPFALLVFLVMVAIFALLYVSFLGTMRRKVNAVGEAMTLRNRFLIEMIGKMRTVRECHAQKLWSERFREISAQATMAGYQAEKLTSTLYSLSYFVMMIAAIAIIVVSVPAVWGDIIGSGALIASLILMWRVLGPAQTVFTNLASVERIWATSRQINSLLQIKGERPDSVTTLTSRTIRGALELSRVSFRYTLSADPALIGVDFRVQPGGLVAITGPNGSGKSTLFRLILGMYQPQAGAILIDNLDIRQLDPIELRRVVSYAPQDAQLFRATISQNLRLARPDATEQDIWQALEMAGALKQIESLPNKLEHRVGDNTNELPSSLRQMISLARAYLSTAPILLLDEPATGLDEAADQQLMRTLQQLKGKRTILYTTHRPSHMRLADTLLVFDRGYLRAMDAPEKLMQQVTAA